MATSQATISATSRTDPATAVACRSICAKRSSRPSPRSPRTVSLRPASRKNRPNAVRPPSAPTPAPGCPPSQVTAKMTRPRTSENDGRNHLERVIPRLRSLVIEHLLDRDAEVPGESERQRKRWGIALVLNRIDGLARHPHRLRQLALSQVLPHPQVAHRVLHRPQVSSAGRSTATGEAASAGSRPDGHDYRREPRYGGDGRPAALPDRLRDRSGRDQHRHQAGDDVQPPFRGFHDRPHFCQAYLS